MVYHQKLIAVIKVNGKILREYGEEVKLPFGSEYVINIKNLHTLRAVINISIDGNDVLDGRNIVIDSNREYELTRFIKNGNLETGPRFKFIEKTQSISNHRGDKIDDGIIRIEYQFEQLCFCTSSTYTDPYNPWVVYPRPWLVDKDVTYGPVRVMSSTVNYGTIQASNTAFNSSGITVGGEESSQRFNPITINTLEPNKHSICIKLVGISNDECLVTKPVTVKSKKECPTCGKVNKSKNKFCFECGTNLNW